MRSVKQEEANRKNAQRSTGPRTPEGKAIVRMNALKHGLLSRQVLLPHESETAFAELAEGMRAELQPVGALEDILVDSVIATIWRLSRLGRVEAGIYALQLFEILEDRADDEILIPVAPEENNPNTIRKEGKDQKALRKAERTRNLGLAFIRDAANADAFSKLSRYETALVRSLHRALHELQRLQAARAGKPVLPPVAVDVDVSGGSGETA